MQCPSQTRENGQIRKNISYSEGNFQPFFFFFFDSLACFIFLTKADVHSNVKELFAIFCASISFLSHSSLKLWHFVIWMTVSLFKVGMRWRTLVLNENLQKTIPHLINTSACHHHVAERPEKENLWLVCVMHWHSALFDESMNPLKYIMLMSSWKLCHSQSFHWHNT